MKKHVLDLRLEAAEKARLDRVVAVLRSISNVTSLAALVRLVEREWDVAELANELGISKSALSPYLRKMYKAKLIRVRRIGRRTIYRCSNISVVKAIREIELGPSDRPRQPSTGAGQETPAFDGVNSPDLSETALFKPFSHRPLS